MKSTSNHSRLAALAFALALAGSAPAMLAHAEDASQTAGGGYYGMGPGMMYGYGMGPGMMGYGMGPGMMYGWGGGYGMGPGMMGYGMGPGMMGPGMIGYGMGPGMMYGWGGRGGGFGSGLDLSAAQQAKINKIFDETRKSHWAIMGAMQDQQAELRDLYSAAKPDEKAIEKAYQNFGRLRQQMFDSAVDAHKRIDAVLTKEQREKLRSYWGRGGW